MTKEEFITARTEIISEMLDNPDECGIYPTTECFKKFDALFDTISAELVAVKRELEEETNRADLYQKIDDCNMSAFHTFIGRFCECIINDPDDIDDVFASCFNRTERENKEIVLKRSKDFREMQIDLNDAKHELSAVKQERDRMRNCENCEHGDGQYQCKAAPYGKHRVKCIENNHELWQPRKGQ